jgi:hypothetical protein
MMPISASLRRHPAGSRPQQSKIVVEIMPRDRQDQRASESLSKGVIIGWIISFAGTTLWLYGYFATGNPSLIDWHANTPWWIADFLPNFESEIGMALAYVGTVPNYWPSRW